jgi:hypothetical protein
LRYFPTQAFNLAFKDTFKKMFPKYNPKTEACWKNIRDGRSKQTAIYGSRVFCISIRRRLGRLGTAGIEASSRCALVKLIQG